MQISIAHLRTQGVDFVVADADATSHMSCDRDAVLGRVWSAARRAGLRVDKAALAFVQSGRPTFYGTPDLVRFLASHGLPRWTHTLTI
jgi:hypothetical protein